MDSLETTIFQATAAVLTFTLIGVALAVVVNAL